MILRRAGGLLALLLATTPVAAQLPGNPPPGRFGLDGDPDPVGAIIERRVALALTEVQFAALRDLRRWHQRAVRQARDSLSRLGLAAGEGHPLLDSTRHWTRVARDSGTAMLTGPQRDSLAALWLRYRDSLPPRLRAGRRPPDP